MQKKKKKNAWLDDEEDADKKAEEAKKAEEEANGNGAAEADPLDDWGAFATVGKKKKGKKGKAEPDEPMAPEPETKSAWDTLDLGTSATADANADDDWGGFTTGKKKKTKKGKVRYISLVVFRQRWCIVAHAPGQLLNIVRYTALHCHPIAVFRALVCYQSNQVLRFHDRKVDGSQ